MVANSIRLEAIASRLEALLWQLSLSLSLSLHRRKSALDSLDDRKIRPITEPDPGVTKGCLLKDRSAHYPLT